MAFVRPVNDFYDGGLFRDKAAPRKGESGGWSEARRARCGGGKKRQNQSAPNLIFSPAGFERTTAGRVGVASVLQPRASVWVRGCVCASLCL